MAVRIAHILFLPSWYPSRNNPLEGVFNRDFAEMMSHHLKITVLSLKQTKGIGRHKIALHEPNSNFSEWVVEVPERTGIGSLFNKFNQVRLYHKIRKRIEKKRGQIDLIHVSVAWPAGLYAWLTKRLKGTPFIITEHYTGYFEEDGSLSGKRKLWSYNLLGRADAITTVSGKLWDELKKDRVNPVIKLIWNNIHTAFTQMPFRQNSQSDNYVFLHASNFDDRQKNTSEIIKTFIALHEEINDTVLKLNVPAQKWETFKTQNPNLNLKGIDWVNPTERKEDYARLMETCDCLISFSNFETFALSVAEAACLGLDIVCTRSGGPEYYLQDGWGKIVNPGDRTALYEAMREYAQTGFSFIRRKAVGTQAREFFDAEKIARSYTELYQQVISNTA